MVAVERSAVPVPSVTHSKTNDGFTLDLAAVTSASPGKTSNTTQMAVSPRRRLGDKMSRVKAIPVAGDRVADSTVVIG
mgnify:CR=1 FL=1